MTKTRNAIGISTLIATTAFATFASAPALADEAFELRLVHNYSTNHYLSQQAIMPWVEQVETRSNERIKITVSPASHLGKEQSNLLRYGLTDKVATAIGDWIDRMEGMHRNGRTVVDNLVDSSNRS